MSPEVLKAKASTLQIWAEEFRNEGGDGTGEVAFLMERTARIMVALATGAPLPELEPPPPKDEPMDEARPG